MSTRHTLTSSTDIKCASFHLSLRSLILFKAMALVTDRLNANKPATPEPKPGKVSSAQLNNNKDLDVDIKKEEPSFFGSFFSASKSQQQKAKKGPQPMEAVRTLSPPISILTCLQTVDMQPPAIIRPQAALNERETLETEVISAYPSIVFSRPRVTPVFADAMQSCSSTRISISSSAR